MKWISLSTRPSRTDRWLSERLNRYLSSRCLVGRDYTLLEKCVKRGDSTIMDFLLSQPGVDPKRFACVGHDFGGMYGVLAGSLDRRPTHYVVMAATPRFPDWYLYRPQLEGEKREAFIRQMAEIDPIAHIPNLSPAPVFFQFATEDRHVPKERAKEFFAAARDPREMKWYEAGHGLDQDARRDRKTWLKEKLGLE